MLRQTRTRISSPYLKELVSKYLDQEYDKASDQCRHGVMGTLRSYTRQHARGIQDAQFLIVNFQGRKFAYTVRVPRNGGMDPQSIATNFICKQQSNMYDLQTYQTILTRWVDRQTEFRDEGLKKIIELVGDDMSLPNILEALLDDSLNVCPIRLPPIFSSDLY